MPTIRTSSTPSCALRTAASASYRRTGWPVPDATYSRFTAKGITAYIDPDDTAEVFTDGKTEPTVLDVNTVAGNDARYHAYGFFGESRHFIDCIKTGRQPDTNFADATKTMELVDSIYHSVL